jgi:hypothetical protein
VLSDNRGEGRGEAALSGWEGNCGEGKYSRGGGRKSTRGGGDNVCCMLKIDRDIVFHVQV